MRILLIPVGSSGDVLPFVALGAELRRRGHDVRVIVNPHFRSHVEAAGLVLEPFGTEAQYLATVRDPRLWHPTRGFRVIAREIVGPAMRQLYEQVESLVLPGQTLAAGSALAIGARLAHDRLGLPYATLHLQPSLFRSITDPPTFDVRMPRSRLGRRAFFWLTDLLFVDRFLRGPINRERRRLGLAPIRHVEPWWHSPQRIIGLFPEWFAAPQADWPGQTVLTGFPLADGGQAQPMPAELDRWLVEGDSPIIFTFGSAMMHAGPLFAAAAEACRRLGRRGLLLTPFTEQVPAPLPGGVVHFPHAPFRALFPRAEAVVHHGGIGTVAQALAAGRPQLIVPFSHDQPDNAQRVCRLNAGAALHPAKAAAPALADHLAGLLASPSIAEGARRCAARMATSQSVIAATCDHLEALGPSGRLVPAEPGRRHP